MTLLLNAFTIGLILSLLALGVYISFRIHRFPDITAEGSFTFGAAVTAALLIAGSPPWFATLAGFLAGFLAGTITGILHTRFAIHGLLAGILVMTALYSVNLHIMGRSNIPLLGQTTILDTPTALFLQAFGTTESWNLFGWNVRPGEIAQLLAVALFVTLCAALLNAYLRTELGAAMRATGDNPQMIRALGVNVDHQTTLGLALSNGLVALAGSLLAQYQGFADVQMGIGMLVWGLASVIIGEALVNTHSRQIGLLILGAILGSILFRLIVAIALRWGLNPNDLKLITALFVFIALIAPGLLAKLRSKKAGLPPASQPPASLPPSH